ncbi:oxidoreductase [Actinocatenispora thailandica]|uniref:Oxidoreductase n=1 Tax=Actinocatenispora thailandica TaxID=227318 RepID=A0A7R7I032_9ACTN|nr:FAD-dependent oxidoreductase [Actinocatenispora thailandica]BCJ38044.1 oxidoreductase [Actinocatenispora thailandica]
MSTQVAIVGAGYSGLAAASRLARRTHGRDVRIQLINAGPDFVERIRLHQVAAGTGAASRPLAELLSGTDVSLRVGTVEAIDLAAGTLRLSDGGPVGYDTLLYAVGSHTRTDAVPGVAEHAYRLDGPVAGRLAAALRAAVGRAGTVVVCGGGLTGIEAATEIAEAYPRLAVTLATRGRIAETVSARTRRHLAAALRRLGVTVRENTTVAAVEPGAVTLAGGGTLPADVAVWCGSFVAPSLAADAGLRTDEMGRIPVEATMRVPGHPEVYAIGDAAAIEMPWGVPRMSCQAGLPTGLYAADAVAARLAGRDPKPYRYRFMDLCISLGRRDGVVQVVRADDRATGLLVAGRAGAAGKDLVCRAAAWAAGSGALSTGMLYPLARSPRPEPVAAATGSPAALPN